MSNPAGPRGSRFAPPEAFCYTSGMKNRLCIMIIAGMALAAATARAGDTPPFAPVDNDVYLHSPELYHILNRYRAGDHFEMLPELEAEVRRRPNLPSSRFWLGFRLLTLSYMKGDDRRDPAVDARIRKEFEACLRVAPQLAKLPGRAHAALHYEAMCSGGLAMLALSQTSVVEAGNLARRSITAFTRLHRLRPELQSSLFAVGAYNYITSQLGAFGKVVLWMLDLPRGDRGTGLHLLQKALAARGPFDTLVRFTLAPIFNNFEDKPDASLAVARSLVAMVPHNAQARFSYAVQLMLAGKLPRARTAMDTALRLMPPPEQDGRLREFALQRRYMIIVDAMLDILLRQDAKALHRLYESNRKTKGVPLSVAASAAFYTAHLFKLAGLEQQARTMYRRVRDSQASRGLRDRAGTYMDEKNIGGQIRLDPAARARLRAFLADKPLPPHIQ